MYYRFLSFFTSPTPTEISTLSLHDALPIYAAGDNIFCVLPPNCGVVTNCSGTRRMGCRFGSGQWSSPRRSWAARSEEHTSELQSRPHLVCRLLLEKKKQPADAYWPSFYIP